MTPCSEPHVILPKLNLTQNRTRWGLHMSNGFPYLIIENESVDPPADEEWVLDQPRRPLASDFEGVPVYHSSNHLVERRRSRLKVISGGLKGTGS